MWAAPPKELHAAIRAYLNGSRDSKGLIRLTSEQKLLVGRRRLTHQLDAEALSKITFAAPGAPFYCKVLNAHEGHVGVDRTFEQLREICLSPPRRFVEIWINKCPSCNKHGLRGAEDSG
jgi:hypothetical protein